MDVPPPAIPRDRLTGWEETTATVEEAFSTPLVTVYTHTIVFEETAAREQIRVATGCDHPWQFFFVSRIRLVPSREPGGVLTALVRRKAAAGFTDRLADRGIEQVTERDRQERPIGDTTGLLATYSGRVRLPAPATDTAPSGSDTTAADQTTATLVVPITAILGVWAAAGDYHVAGGGVPADSPDSGPTAVVDAVTDAIDPPAAREEILALIEACGQATSA